MEYHKQTLASFVHFQRFALHFLGGLIEEHSYAETRRGAQTG
jgi:hypothetical protein